MFDKEFALIIINNIRRLVIISGEGSKELLPTLGINNKGELYVNKEFWYEHMQDSDARKTVLLHELMHTICGDTKQMLEISDDDLEVGIKRSALNIATDARINAYIYRSNRFDCLSFFNKFYSKDKMKKEELLALLRPEAKDFLKNDELKRQYEILYSISSTTEVATYDDIYAEVLDILRKRPKQEKSCYVIGKHGAPIDKDELKKRVENGEKITVSIEENGNSSSDEDTEDQIKEAIEGQIEADKLAGKSSNIQRVMYELATDITKKLDLTALKQIKFNSIFHNVRLAGYVASKEITSSPIIPNKLHKSDLFMLSRGITPVMWKHEREVFRRKPELIPIYLDVSGSMWEDLPEIIQMILNIGEDIEYVWCFSNIISKHTMQDLHDRKIESTGGTDFDCVINHAIDNEFRDIVVITDGYATVRHDTQKKHNFNLKDKVPKIDSVVVVLTENYSTERNYFSEIYKDTHPLGAVTL